MNVGAGRAPNDARGIAGGDARAFASYLATRPDLFPIGVCARLAAIGRDLDPLVPPEVDRMVASELGAAWTDAFATFGSAPVDVNAATQAHAAVLTNGEPVLVILPRTWRASSVLLQRTLDAWPDEEPPRSVLKQALAEFHADCLSIADVVAQKAAWQALAQDTATPVRPAAVVDYLSTRRVLVLRQLEGLPVTATTLDSVATARSLCTAWFVDVLLGRPFAVDPIGRWMLSLPAGGFGRGGGALDTLPLACAERLRTYLVCVAAEEPDRAAALLAHLLHQLTPAAELRLARELRQFVPARDWKWPCGQKPVSLADHVLGHWRAATVVDARAPRHLLSFYRGLFQLARDVEAMDPESQSLAAAFYDALVTVGFVKTRQLFTLDGLRGGALDVARLAAILPRGLDDALSGAAEDRASAADDETWMHVERIDVSITLLWCVLFLIVARLAPSGWARALTSALIAVAFAVLARAAWRLLRSEAPR